MDSELFFLINQSWTHPALDRVMALLSSWDAWWPVVALLVIAVGIRGGFRGRAWILATAAVVGLCDGAISKPLKAWSDRPRPYESMAGVRQVDLGKAKPRLLALGKKLKYRVSPAPTAAPKRGRSFPSSHMVNTAAAALAAVCFFGWRRAGAVWLLPLGVGYSRVYTGAHWPSDVVFSLALGAGVALLGVAVLEWAWRRHGARGFPALHARHPSLLSA